MNLKKGLFVICTAAMMSLTACGWLDSSDVPDTVYPDDAEITAFSLAHDSVSTLTTTVFSIDQKNNRIFNRDSMAFLTALYEKAVITFSTSTNLTKLLQVQQSGDSVWIASGDSIEISPQFNLVAYGAVPRAGEDTVRTKIYTVNINIHAVDPDSVQYHLLGENILPADYDECNGFRWGDSCYTFFNRNNYTSVEVYKSADMKNWELVQSDIPNTVHVKEIRLCGDKVYFAYLGFLCQLYKENFVWRRTDTHFGATQPQLLAVLGYLPKGALNDEGLSCIMNKDSKNTLAFLNFDSNNLEEGAEVGKDFPFTEYSVVNQSVLSSNILTLVGGQGIANDTLNSVWSTENGVYWAKMNKGSFSDTVLIYGGNAFRYNDEIYWINGYNYSKEKDEYNRDIYHSDDYGVTWKKMEEKCQPPATFTPRTNAATVVSKDGKYFYIIGGKDKQQQPLRDVWQVFLNSRTFE